MVVSAPDRGALCRAAPDCRRRPVWLTAFDGLARGRGDDPGRDVAEHDGLALADEVQAVRRRSRHHVLHRSGGLGRERPLAGHDVRISRARPVRPVARPGEAGQGRVGGLAADRPRGGGPERAAVARHDVRLRPVDGVGRRGRDGSAATFWSCRSAPSVPTETVRPDPAATAPAFEVTPAGGRSRKGRTAPGPRCSRWSARPAGRRSGGGLPRRGRCRSSRA